MSNTLVQVAGKAGIAVMSLVTSKLLATYLMVHERGQYDFIYGILAVVGIVADMGLYTIAIREISKDENQMEKIIGNILSIRNVLVILTIGGTFTYLGISNWITGQVPNLNFYLALLLASTSMMITLLNGTVTSVLQVKYEMKHATLAQIIGKFVIIVIMAISMYVLFTKASPGFTSETSFWGFQMLFFSGIVGNFVMYMYTRYNVRKYTKLKYRFDFDMWKRLIRESFPYGFALMIGTIYFKIDLILLRVLYADPRFAETQIGYYAAPIKVLEAFTQLPFFFLNAVLPLLSIYIKENDEKLPKLIQYSFDFLYIMAAPMVAGGVALGYQIINATNSEAYLSRLSDGFVGSDILLQILIFTLLFSFLNLLFNFILMAVGKQKLLIYINLISLAFNVVANVIFIPKFGLVAASIITVLTELVVLICTFVCAKKYVVFNINFMRAAKISVISLLLGLMLWVLKDSVTKVLGNDFGMLGLTVFAAAAYTGMIFLFRVVDKDMVRLIKKNA